MGKLYSVAKMFESKLEEMPDSKRKSLEKTLKELDFNERITYMNMQAEMFASGLIDKDDAMFLYVTLKDWEDATLARRIVVIEMMGQYASLKIKKATGRMSGEKKPRKATKRARTTRRKRENLNAGDRKYSIIDSTPWINDVGGRYRYVIIEWYKPNGEVREYSSHMQNESDGATYYGDYAQTKQSAVNSAIARYQRDKRVLSPEKKPRKATRKKKPTTKRKSTGKKK